MAAENGHHASRSYRDQNGAFHNNSAAFFDDNEVDISDKLNSLGLTSSAASAADSLAMPITARVVTKTTGGDAEALTLADGTPGQKLTIVLVTDGGGDGTLTPTTVTGFATVVLADAGDSVTLEFVDSTVGWIITGASGVAAPPAITV
jgi:hypothetical protein|tara:strand:+ start:183 stop:626 length:444 start_codon:yes stop_codon:yes gene_type:complete